MNLERRIRQEMAEEDYTDDEIEMAVDRYWDNQIDKYEASQEEKQEIWP